MNDSTFEYLEGIAKTDIQKKLLQLFSEKTDCDDDYDLIVKEILTYMREASE
jgi:hypothetical protein